MREEVCDIATACEAQAATEHYIGPLSIARNVGSTGGQLGIEDSNLY